MNWTPERILIFGLSVLLLLAGMIILKLYRERKKSDNEGGSHDFVSLNKHKEVLKDRDNLRNEIDLLKQRGLSREIDPVYNDLQEKYERACVEIGNLKRKIDELTRDNNELNVLYGNDSTTNVDKRQVPLENPAVVHSHEEEVLKETKGGQHTMYTSFPRSAGSSIYFSDLTDKLSDDSYFELRITNDSGVASFRPLDFMKIRNYDPAMAAILTEGVKPNVASTVVGVESGEAQLEGNDWIIKRLAKVKLA